jgi:hypothetical protein
MGEGNALAAGGAVLLLGAMILGLRGFLRLQDDPFVRRAILWGAVAKIAGTIARYQLVADLYGGVGDFNRYLRHGTALAETIRAGVMPGQASTPGSDFLDFLAGLLFTVTPPSLVTGFAVFSLLAYVGQCFFLRAFQVAVPDGDHRRYAVLVLFAPTLLFWPSSMGKEAWLVFTLGLAAYGAARVLRRRRSGYALSLLGGTAIFMVRPHMAALFALSFAGAYILRFRDPDVGHRTVGWLVGLVVIIAGAGIAAANFGDLLPQDESVQGSQTDQIFAETLLRTDQGGSQFDSRPVRNPVDFLHAVVTVPFRPFPNEGANLQAQVAGLEGLLLFGLFLASGARLGRLPRELLRRPFLAMAAAYTVGFVIAFSNVANFGILTRQRAQLLPVLFVLICLPDRTAGAKPRRDAPVLAEVSPLELVSSAPPPVRTASRAGSDLARVGGPSTSSDSSTVADRSGSAPTAPPREQRRLWPANWSARRRPTR